MNHEENRQSNSNRETREPRDTEREIADQNQKAQRSSRDEDRTFRAATHGVDDAKPVHPGHAEVASESTGRKADDDWKKDRH